MNELAWEGLIEILRGNQPSLKATARLWRRDDFFGSDWGGQLELPLVFRRLLPPDDYDLRLPSGSEAHARVEAGPSTTSMTFPTMTGIGHPPFGGAVARPAEAELELDPAEEITQDQPAVIAPQPVALTPQATGSAPASSEATAEPVVVEAAAPAPRRLTVVAAHPESTEGDAPAIEGAAGIEGIEPTEAMARAYLGAVEARQRLQAVARPGFEGRALEAASHNLDAATATIEGALRARAGSDRWPQELAGHLAALSWFASLALTDAQPDVAGAGRAVQSLVATIEQLLASNVAVHSPTRAA